MHRRKLGIRKSAEMEMYTKMYPRRPYLHDVKSRTRLGNHESLNPEAGPCSLAKKRKVRVDLVSVLQSPTLVPIFDFKNLRDSCNMV